MGCPGHGGAYGQQREGSREVVGRAGSALGRGSRGEVETSGPVPRPDEVATGWEAHGGYSEPRGAWHPPSMWAQGSGPCTFMLLAWLMGTARSWTLSSWGPAPRNSTGVPTASLQRLSVWGPFLSTLWTLVALSSLLGKHAGSVEGLHSCSRNQPPEVCALVSSTVFLVSSRDSLSLGNILGRALPFQNGRQPPCPCRAADKPWSLSMPLCVLHVSSCP